MWASGLYLSLVIGLAIMLGHELKISLSIKSDVIYAFLLFLLLALLMTMPLGMHHADYFRTFPLLEAEKGIGTVLRGWYDDTVFHVSIIQSILNFGYPSIGQHGAPPMIYHVLSHYFDAFIVFATGLDPFDAYGMFALLKRFALLAMLCLLVSKLVGETPFIAMFGFTVFIPLNIDMWLPVISHGLWLPTLIFLGTLPWVYRKLFIQESNSLIDLISFFLLVIVISFGKVSFGFIYAAFIGCVVLFKHPKSSSTYVLGALWLLFFYLYSMNMPIESSATHGLNLRNVTFSSVLDLVASSHWIAYAICFCVLPALIIRKTNIQQCYFFSSSGFLIIICAIVVSVCTNLGPADKGYFQLATYTVLLSYSFILIGLNIPIFVDNANKNKLYESVLYVLLVVVMSIYSIVNFSTFSEKLLDRNREPYRVLNNSLMQPNLSLFSSIKNWRNRGWFISESGEIYTFRRKVNETIDRSNHSKAESALYLPSEVYHELPHDYGEKWAAGMFLYSVTGVPLLNAIKEEKVRGYGIYLYGNDAKRKRAGDFLLEEACDVSKVKQVLVVNSFSPPVIESLNCIGKNRSKEKQSKQGKA
ncbi:hypothetical protein [Salinivibrio proteolyticus]|uniref:Uncharacterized protein n=1 Tax=Salinivibrio proteolyticus TaxID=334715 RepID=A0ABY7LCR5_9GAMM|nr:hypothetical protein [Salinivibrio proteolyticus]WBA13966.1 hypothetical protein N7E60_09525 [Salinivibrio proteolyticus]